MLLEEWMWIKYMAENTFENAKSVIVKKAGEQWLMRVELFPYNQRIRTEDIENEIVKLDKWLGKLYLQVKDYRIKGEPDIGTAISVDVEIDIVKKGGNNNVR